MKKYFYEKNDYLINHDVNKTFDEILLMTKEEFRQWCIDLRCIVVYTWDILGIPPRVGYNELEMIEQFKKLSNYPVHEFLIKDELTKEKNVIRNTQNLGNAVNQFFETMMKTRINYTDDDSDGKSIYDFFAREDLLERFVTYATRHFKRDSFYHYSVPIKQMDITQYGNLPISDNAVDWLTQFHNGNFEKGNYSYWLSPKKEDAIYTGYNEKLKDQQYLTLRKEQIQELNLDSRYTTNVDFEKSELYQIRIFEKGQKLFPIGLKAFRVSFCQYAVNYPPLTAKYIYERYSEKGRKNIVWDPSSGWGGRLLGAMAVKDDRTIHYIGNDPNTDHDTDKKRHRTKYHEIYDFYRSNVKKGGLFPIDHNTFEFYQLGSEVIQYNRDFLEYKGLIDLVFTSPPYFSKEKYSDDPEQSCIKFDTYDLWREGFLYQTLKTAYQWLKPNGHLIFNISDVKFGNNMLSLVDDSKSICDELGFNYIETLKMTLSQMPGSNRLDENGKAKTKYSCRVKSDKGSIILKYEPVMIFRK